MSGAQPSFAGSVAANYRRYLMPLSFTAYAHSLAGRVPLRHGARLLEVACGTGAVTQVLHNALPMGATLTATDLNPDMLAEAEALLGPAADVQFQVADGTALPFDDASFDTVLCQFGVMFFPDLARGFAEAARVLKPGGALVFSVWDALPSNPLPALVFDTVKPFFPAEPPAIMQLPFSCHDIQALRHTLAGAGFQRMSFHVERRRCHAPDAQAIAMGFIHGSPLGADLEQQGVSDAAVAAVIAALESQYGTGAINAPMQAVEVIAYPD